MQLKWCILINIVSLSHDDENHDYLVLILRFWVLMYFTKYSLFVVLSCCLFCCELYRATHTNVAPWREMMCEYLTGTTSKSAVCCSHCDDMNVMWPATVTSWTQTSTPVCKINVGLLELLAFVHVNLSDQPSSSAEEHQAAWRSFVLL